jgi:hypothetical protein
MSLLYMAITGVNQFYSGVAKTKFSKLEKIAIGATILAGIDVSITPMFTGGQTLHEYLGISPQENANNILKVSELIAAYAGVVYQYSRNSRKQLEESIYSK